MKSNEEYEAIITGKTNEFKPLEYRLVNGTSEEQIWDEMVRRWHYLGYKKMIGTRVKYLVCWQNTPISAISFNRPSLHVGVRDQHLGWNDETRHKLLPHVVNNNRFLILPWVRIKNLASHILSQTLRRLPKDWEKLYGVEPYAVETFVDVSRHPGTCYKAANWLYLGETRGYGKVGKAFVYHGNKKSVFLYILNRKLLQEIARTPRRPFSKSERERLWDMILCEPDWSPTLFEESGINEETVAALGEILAQYLDFYASCFSRSAQQRNAEIYIKGLLSDLVRKSVEPIALRYADEKAVRTLQQFQKDAPWNDAKMKELYQDRVLANFADQEGMLTIDGSDFVKKGNCSAGVTRQYCGRMGKVENCQAGVFIGYSGLKGYGLLDACLYLPVSWFDESHKQLWKECDIPEDATFKTKPQLAMDMIGEINDRYDFPFRWIGCDSAFGCDSDFRAMLPESVYFFADIRSNQHVFLTRPEWAVPARKSNRGKAPTLPIPSIKPIRVSDIAEDKSMPWEETVIAVGSKGPTIAKIKRCRVIECIDGKDEDECWLYIRQYENDEIRYALSNAPADIEPASLDHASVLRWPIEQAFRECKSELGMKDYETRSYVGWHRHMLLVMLAHLFVLETRFSFVKKKKTANLGRY